MSDRQNQENGDDDGSSSEYIELKVVRVPRLTVVGQDQDPIVTEIHFRVRMTMEMGNLMKRYTEMMGPDQCDLRFLFDGRRINADETPKQLELKDGAVIQVSQTEYIKLKVAMAGNPPNNEVHFRVTMTTQMDKLMRRYAEIQGVPVLRFLFNGRRITCDETPKQLKMKDGDVIEVFYPQYG